MRTTCKNPIKIKNVCFGGENTLSCLPMIPKTEQELYSQTKELVQINPDIIEWRIDYYDEVSSPEKVAKALINISKIINDIPLIFTFRHVSEGGFKKYSQDIRLEVIEKALNTGCVDLIDVEMSNEKEFIDRVKELTVKYSKTLILSYHDFEYTPDEDFIYNKILEGARLGADIPKLALMAKDYGDVLKVMNANYKARVEEIDSPIITMSMGQIGSISRIIGGMFGSDMTFAVGKESSAPGQISISTLREVWRLI